MCTDIWFKTPHQSRIRSTARCFACKTRRRLRQFSTLEKPCFKSSFYLLKCYFFKSLWQSNLKYTICFYIPLNPSVRRVRRVYTLILNFTYNHAMNFSKKTLNPTCQCFLLVTFLSRKKSDKTRPLRIPRVCGNGIFLTFRAYNYVYRTQNTEGKKWHRATERYILRTDGN